MVESIGIIISCPRQQLTRRLKLGEVKLFQVSHARSPRNGNEHQSKSIYMEEAKKETLRFTVDEVGEGQENQSQVY